MFKTIARVACLGAIAGFMSVSASQAADFTFQGASQFDYTDPFTKLMVKFGELTKLYYSGDKTIDFVMHPNSELGLEKDYFNYMSQGISVDYAVVAPAHMSTYSKMATLYDPPMLYRDPIQWSKVMQSDILKPIEEDILKRADVRILGYGGGGIRELITRKPVHTMADIKNMPIRVMGAPIQTQMFQAFGMAPTVIAYSEVYNAMQTGRIQAAENEAFGIQQMKFYEVGPYIDLTKHAITVRPLCFSNKTFVKLPKDLQEAILQAGKDASTYGRVVEASGDSGILEKLQKEGKLHIVTFKDRAKLYEDSKPVVANFFKSLGASALLKRIQAVK